MQTPADEIHWTEIYVIITVSAALLEDIRTVGRCSQRIGTLFMFIAIFRSVLIFIHK